MQIEVEVMVILIFLVLVFIAGSFLVIHATAGLLGMLRRQEGRLTRLRGR